MSEKAIADLTAKLIEEALSVVWHDADHDGEPYKYAQETIGKRFRKILTAAALPHLRVGREEIAARDVLFVFGEMLAQLQACKAALVTNINALVKYDDPPEAKDGVLGFFRALDQTIADGLKAFDATKAADALPAPPVAEPKALLAEKSQS